VSVICWGGGRGSGGCDEDGVIWGWCGCGSIGGV
jgi:hypothetical protein